MFWFYITCFCSIYKNSQNNKQYDVENTKETPITEKAEVIEDEINTPETAADKIIKGESKWGKFYTEWIDRFTPIENLAKKAEQNFMTRGV